MTPQFFAPCPRGLEKALAAELTTLGAVKIATVGGGVAFEGDDLLMYKATLYSRLASRVLWLIESGTYRNEQDIYARAQAIDWTRYFNETRSIRVDVTATRSPLKSLDFATLRVKDAICDRFRDEGKLRPAVEKHQPDVRVMVYLSENQIALYLDTSGEALFKRGYRKTTEEVAPLRENLAAGLLILSGWTPEKVFLDPFCGSGTIAIEAALMASDAAPGLNRAFGFQKLRIYDGPTWQRLRQTARDSVHPSPSSPMIFASDIKATSIVAAKTHAALAHVSDWIDFSVSDVVSREAPAASGVWIANPPYGVRLEDEQFLKVLYPALGRSLKHRFAGWEAWFLTADKKLPGSIGMKPYRKTPLYNGKIDCRFFGFKIVEGGMRRVKKGESVA
jgi:putative N6-adenine-specific DNA methylase